MLLLSGSVMTVSTEQVWQELSRKLRSFFRRRVADDQLAEDLLQETFLRIHNGIDSLQERERLAAWVYRIARNTLMDHFRKGPSKEVLADNFDISQDQPDTNYNEEVAGWLGYMVESLPAKYRAAVKLSELEGVTQREVSEQLGLSISGAKSRVQRGRKKLKETLLDCCHLELDGRGNVVDYQPRASRAACCSAGTAAESGKATN